MSSPFLRLPRTGPLRERLIARTTTDPATGCWLWQSTRSEQGYGLFAVYRDGRKFTRPAHRLMYETEVGPVPDGLVLDHLCRRPPCINPAHLEPVTHVENILRGVGPTAHNARKMRCIHGHALTEDNVYRTRAGNRHCRECALRRAREHKARKKVA